ncbi:MAG: hypothetical protein KGI10_09900 [Thaumarchaeota archaeon]|nr:hypothetical protein [Nitrososphaerota archaeon]
MLPRKGYGTITVKVEAFQKFRKAIHDEKKTNPRIQNSTFIDLLLEAYRKSKT